MARPWRAHRRQPVVTGPSAGRPAAVNSESVRTGRRPPRSGRLDSRAADPLAVTLGLTREILGAAVARTRARARALAGRLVGGLLVATHRVLEGFEADDA